MKKNVISALVLLSTVGLYAQTGIGTSLPNPSSELEIASINKGVLVPRLGLEGENDKSTVAGGNSYPEGLFVYNDGSKGFAIGFYYWSKGKWNALVSNNTLYKYIEEKADPNSVVIIREGKDFIFTWKEGDVTKTKNISGLVKDFETVTTLVSGFTDDTKTKKTGVYIYTNEKNVLTEITVISDVLNNFESIINNTDVKKVLNEYFNEKVVGNVTYKNGDFYYTVKKGDNLYEDQVINIQQIIEKSAYLASLVVKNTDNVGDVEGGFTFKDGKDGSAPVSFAETLTVVERGTEKGVGKEKLIAYNYKDETGKNGIVQITVSSDIINNFDEIIKNEKVITELNAFITNATGGVTVSKDAVSGNITISYKEGDTKQTLDLTNEVKRVQNYGVVSGTAANTVDKKGTGFTFNNGKAEAGSYLESVTGFTTTTSDVDFSDGTKGKSIVYNYKDESINTHPLNITEDVATSFKTIINKGDNKTYIESIVNSTAPAAKIVIKPAEDNTDLVKAGFTFNDGKTGSSDIKFAETLTTLKPEAITVYVYLDFVHGDYIEVHENTEREADELGVKPTALRTYLTNKYVYTNEKGTKVEFKASDLFGGTGTGKTNETLTKLTFDENYEGSGRKAFVYTDENGTPNPIYADDIFKQSENLTELKIDYDTRIMTYKDEAKVTHEFNLENMVKQPWLTAGGKPAIDNTKEMYSMGWVGIGVKTRTSAPNERLSVDGSITATNSYYADYVFEKYFDGYSTLKYDYNFKDLNTINSFIKENRHLPGITPISELRKTESGYAFNVSELSIQLLEKTEELFLHVIEQQKELDNKTQEIQNLRNDMSKLFQRLEALESNGK